MADGAWLALTCTREGAVAQVLRDDLGVARAGARFVDLVDEGSTRKAQSFLDVVTEKGSLAGWELDVPSGGGARTLSFTGAACGDLLLIAGAPAPRDAMSNQLYEELSRLNNELINRERELARKSAALERLSAEKSRILAIAAHDLRNPLTVIVSYADMLRVDADLSGEPLLYLEEISRSARFMAELVEELLDSSRLESGYVDVDLQDIDLVNAARHAATINRMRGERKQIAIAFEQETDRAVIRADAVKLRQIINNLVVNAIKFSPIGTSVTIRVGRDDGHAIVEVEDHGIGIPRDKLATIFEPFKTLGPSGTAGEKSTGLGLAIVKQLADLHSAKVDVESEEGRGSLFRVSFPLVR